MLMSDEVSSSDEDLPADDGQMTIHEGLERRRFQRPVLSPEMKAMASTRAKGICECSNQNCWHYHRCKSRGVAFLAKRSMSGAVSCSLFCRECARTAGGRGDRL
jgi:hypothetical protein